MRRVLITGGTGSFGRAMVSRLLQDPSVEWIGVYSRDEAKHAEMRASLGDPGRVRFLVGDVRDQARVRVALRDVDTVIHAAAMKRIEACAYNPGEAYATNVGGTAAVHAEALEAPHLTRALFISSDKSVSPENLYGATKMVGEGIWLQGQHYTGSRGPSFLAVRYGNVLGSRGSVIPTWQAALSEGREVEIRDPGATRFLLPMRDALDLVLRTLERGRAGELWLPRCVAATVETIADALSVPEELRRTSALQPGEKMHEALFSPEEAKRAVWTREGAVIRPEANGGGPDGVDPVPRTSDEAPRLTVPELRQMLMGAGLMKVAA